MEPYISNPIFYQKTKWFVWSIRTTFMRCLAKQGTQTSSFRQNLTFSKKGHVQIFRNVFIGQKNPAGGYPDSKTKVVNTSQNNPDPIRTNLYLKISFYSNLIEHRGFSIRIAKILKLLRKRSYVLGICQFSGPCM